MTISNQSMPASLKMATETLIENLLASEAFVRYSRAKMMLEADQNAKSKLEELLTLQAKIRSAQMNGGVSQQQIEQLRAVQQEVQQNRVIIEYAQSQQAAIEYLREINQEISKLIGIDFASLARQSSC